MTNDDGISATLASSYTYNDAASDPCNVNTYNAPYQDGTGTSGDPWIICTPTQLNAMRQNFANTNYYKLGDNIDMSGYGNWDPLDDNGSNDDAS